MVPALIGFFAAGFVGFVVPNVLLPTFTHQPSGTLPVVLSIIANGSIHLVLLLIPISLAIALLRYRLWDIDVIINRALVGAMLSVLLAIIYAGLIIGLGSLVGLIAPKIGQPIVIVVSTLAIAALFQPFRRHIQQLIDRSFYRGKYDATRTLEEFSDRLRNEVNLAQVREHLLSVVQETMQPVYLSLWLFTDKPADNPHADMLIKSNQPVPNSLRAEMSVTSSAFRG
jgi:divalent metal cation (Fe/Co/Zn/Cd) transporter